MDSVEMPKRKRPETFMERQIRLSKEAKDMTENCKAHNCPYLKRFSGSYKSAYDVYLYFYCGYCDITGNARINEPENADPHNCTHWQDDVSEKKTKLIFNPF